VGGIVKYLQTKKLLTFDWVPFYLAHPVPLFVTNNKFPFTLHIDIRYKDIHHGKIIKGGTVFL